MTSRYGRTVPLCLLSLIALVRASLAQGADDVPVTTATDSPSPSLTQSLPDFSLPDPTVPSDGSEIIARMNAIRANLGGDLGEDFKLLVMRELQKQQDLFPQQLPGAAAPAGIPTWVSIGPTNANFIQNSTPPNPVVDSGRIRTILPHPVDPDTVYVLTSGGGLWKTTNFTQPKPTWVPLTDAVVSTSGGSVAFGRTPETLYLGVGDPFNELGLIAGVMVKSTDGGRTWSPFVDLPGATQVRDVKVDVSGPNDIVLVATDFGLFRSTDNGATYVRVAARFGQSFFRKSIWSLVRTRAGWLATARNRFGVGSVGSMHFSTNQGATWQPIPNAGNVFSGAGRTTLAVGKPGDAVVYAFAARGLPFSFSEFTQLDLFKSVDGGLNWTALNITNKAPTNPSFFQPTMDLMGGQAFYNQMILVDPSDPSRNTVYLGGQLATAKTTDGGQTWTLLSDWLSSPTGFFASKLPYVHADHHAAAFSNLGPKPTVFFGTDGGLFISTDGGTSWSDSKNEGIVSALVQTISSDPIHPSRIIIGLQDMGTRVRIPNTTTYNQTFGGDGEGVGWSQANGTVSLTSVPFSRIFRTVNNPPNIQNKWEFASNGIGGLDFYDFFTPIITPAASADTTGLVFFHHTGQKVYRTADGAGFWTVIGRAGTGGISPSRVFRFNAGFGVHTMDVSPVDTDHVAVSAFEGFLVLTRDGGLSWVERNIIALVPGYGGFNGSVAWANNEILYLSSFNPFGNSIRLVKSTDGGVSWSVAQTGLPDVPILRLLVDPRDLSGNTVYAATWIGVHRTTDGGASWSLFGAGLPRVFTSDLYMPPDGSFLRAATFGRGVWEIKP